MKIKKLRDQLDDIKMRIEDEVLVCIILNGFSPPYEPFLQGVYAHETFPNFENLWDYFIQRVDKETVSARVDEIQNLSLIRKLRRGYKKGGPDKG